MVLRSGGLEKFADPQEESDVSLYHDASTAPLLDLRRRFKAVVDLLSAIIRDGVSLARSVELAVQWDGILRVGPIHPITAEDFCWLGVRILDSVVRWCRVFTAGFRILSMVWLCIVGLRLFVVGGVVTDSLVHPYKWLRPELVPPAPFLQCDPALTPGCSGVLADPVRIDEEFRKAWLPYFCRSGQRETNLEEFAHEVEGWLPVLPEVSLPRLTGGLLADVVHRKGVTAGAWTAWTAWTVGGKLRCCQFLGLMVLHAFCLVLRILGFGLRGCLMPYCYDS